MSERFVEHHYGRFLLSAPMSARLTSFSATIGTIELAEFDLGDDSPAALELGWQQVTELHRERDEFVDTRALPGMREAEFGRRDERKLVVLEQRGDAGLLLETYRAAGLPELVEQLRRAYVWPRPNSRKPTSFGLARGVLELPIEHPEEVAVTLAATALRCQVRLDTCTVAATSASDFESAKRSIEAMPGSPVEVEVRARCVDGMSGEEMVSTVVGVRDELLEHHFVWRFEGRAGEVEAPELEIELTLAGVSRDIARGTWEEVVTSLRRVESSP